MRSAWTGLAVVSFLFLASASLWSQQTQPTQAQSAATKDPQAITIVNQALTATGGASAISAITDYTATGTVTYQLPQPNVQGTVTLRALGIGQFRMDSNLPTGVRSEVNSDTAQIKDHGLTRAYPVPMSPGRIPIPTMPLVFALTSASLNLTYKGMVELTGRSVHQIEVQRFLPISIYDPNGYFHDFHTLEFFIDASTFQILMTQDVVVKKSVRELWYSDYRSYDGLLLPFSIGEQVDGRATWQITIGQITFNSGLQDSDFQL